MPHKHRRRPNTEDGGSFNLAPSSFATPLPVRKIATAEEEGPKKKAQRQSRASTDDTPKEFLRLMRKKDGVKARNGLDDDNSKPTKKRKREHEEPSTLDRAQQPAALSLVIPPPQILPGESLHDFAIRVDQALPVTGLGRKGQGGRLTKTSRRLKKMQDQWREEEARLQEKRQAQQEEQEDHEAEMGLHDAFTQSRSKKGKKRRGRGGDKEGDIWAKVESRRLNDIVQAPPDLSTMKKGVRKLAADVVDVPKKSGSLRKREELGQVRRDVVASYRRLMDGKRHET
ncbi:MAG: hypothetical protein M1814_005535 [Vezdaea aestivalis]|nr:MAG: hypothetical protein M1814_005535 [Vezdaea aestivalis]